MKEVQILSELLSFENGDVNGKKVMSYNDCDQRNYYNSCTFCTDFLPLVLLFCWNSSYELTENLNLKLTLLLLGVKKGSNTVHDDVIRNHELLLF